MLTLGLCDGHDAGACLVNDGAVTVAVSEERLTGRKRQAGFPARAIRWCLDAAGRAPQSVDCVAAAERRGRAMHRLFDGWYRRTDPNLPMNRAGNRLSMHWQNFVAQRRALGSIDASLGHRVLGRRLAGLGIDAPLTLVDHHDAHALAAARTSGFAAALVVSMDAYGDGASTLVGRWHNGTWQELRRVPFPHSPALLYGLTTAHLGFVEGDEGKVAGLAAIGDPAATRAFFADWFRLDDGALRLSRTPSAAALRRGLRDARPADIAAGLQAAVEEAVSRFVATWMTRTQSRRLCLTGGLFANVKLNQTVAEAAAVDDLYVFPHMGDGGLCVGAALAVTEGGTFAPLNVFCGPEADVPLPLLGDRAALTTMPLSPATLAAIAQTLANDGVIGLFAGDMEFGPRALGHRSLVFSARSPALAEQVNRALKRPPIMPFAPAVRDVDFAQLIGTPAWTAFRHMTVTARARAGTAERFPVAVHADGTMRVQRVHRDDAPLLYDILAAYGRHAQPPVLINTSFNEHTEPIIASAARAVELFDQIPLAGLVLGDHYVTRAA
jgi:carbamoyltransferase